jgi:ATP-dependent Clp protease, protease subunit
MDIESSQFHRLDDALESAALKERRLFISKSVDMDLAEDIIKKLWFLERASAKEQVVIVINSPGGSVDAGFAIWDQIKMMPFPIVTLVTGLAASMGSVLALCAPKNKRFATPMSRFLIHQPSLNTVIEGQATDLEIQAKEILKTKKQIVDLYCEASGKSAVEIEKAIDRDRWMSAQEALEFGLISKMVASYKDLQMERHLYSGCQNTFVAVIDEDLFPQKQH